MKSPLESLIEQSANVDLFSPDSRYTKSTTLEYTSADGRQIKYLERRILPQSENLSLVREYTVVQDDRLDSIAYNTLGNPLLFWRIADANNAMNPLELTDTVNRKLKIALPEGVPAPTPA